jgi:hypothetical protein
MADIKAVNYTHVMLADVLSPGLQPRQRPGTPLSQSLVLAAPVAASVNPQKSILIVASHLWRWLNRSPGTSRSASGSVERPGKTCRQQFAHDTLGEPVALLKHLPRCKGLVLPAGLQRSIVTLCYSFAVL